MSTLLRRLADRARTRTGRRVLPIAAIAVACLFAAVVVGAREAPYWGQPDVPVTVVDRAHVGYTDTGYRSSCDAWLATVAAGDGRTGRLLDCGGWLAVGERTTVQWHPDEPGTVRDDVLGPQGLAAIVGGIFVALVLFQVVVQAVLAARGRRAAAR